MLDFYGKILMEITVYFWSFWRSDISLGWSDWERWNFQRRNTDSWRIDKFTIDSQCKVYFRKQRQKGCNSLFQIEPVLKNDSYDMIRFRKWSMNNHLQILRTLTFVRAIDGVGLEFLSIFVSLLIIFVLERVRFILLFLWSFSLWYSLFLIN